MYQLIIKKIAKKKLQSLDTRTKLRITEQIVLLGKDPDNSCLDIKKMQGTSQYRLRVGQWRVIFDRDDNIKIISVEKIGARGDVYK